MAGGAPTKRTAENAKTILGALALDGRYKYAAAMAGMAEITLIEWRKADQEFSLLCEKARQEWARGRLTKIERAADDGSWQASAWMLERTMRDEFAKPESVPATQADESKPAKLVKFVTAKTDDDETA